MTESERQQDISGPVSAEEERLLRESLERLRSDFDVFSTRFYEALFRREPALRKMFRDDLTGQGMKFITTLDEVVSHVREPAANPGKLSELGSYHASLGVVPEHFAPMEEALIDTIRSVLGDACSAEHERAWRKAYAQIAATMIAESGKP